MNMSESCSQTVEHSCHNQIILSGFSSWLGRNDKWNSYWHGDRDFHMDSYGDFHMGSYGRGPNRGMNRGPNRFGSNFGCECASNGTCQVSGI